jgi:hypothetical protein
MPRGMAASATGPRDSIIESGEDNPTLDKLGEARVRCLYALYSGMDHEQTIAQAEKHVAEGERRIVGQRELIEVRESLGLDNGPSRALLSNFEKAQRMHVADRDRLRRE